MNRKIYFKLLMFLLTLCYVSTSWSQNPGTALDCASNETTNYAQISGSTGLITTTLTLSAWLKIPTSISASQYFFGKKDTYLIGFADLNTFKFARITKDPAVTITYPFTPNRWYYITTTFNGLHTISLYVDGVFVGSNSTANLFDGLPYNTIDLPWYIGARKGWGYTFFQDYFWGSLDEIRLYNSVLSDTEIQDGMFNEAAGTETNLKAYYKFNETSGTVITDATSNGNSGALTTVSKSIASTARGTSYAMVRPTATAATNISTSGFTANWLAPTNATVTSYVIDVANTVDFANPIVNNVSVTGTSYTVSGNPYTTEYYYRVRGIGDAGITTNSNLGSVDFIAPTISIGTVAANPYSASVAVTLSQKGRVYYSTTQATLTTNGGNTYLNGLTGTISLTSLTPLTNYTYYFVEKDDAGNLSTVSPITFSTTADVTAPILSIATISATASTASTMVTVNEASTVYYSLTLPVGTTNSINVTTTGIISLTELSNGTNYTLYAVAKDAYGNTSSVSKAFTTVVLPDTQAPILTFNSITNTTNSTRINLTSNETARMYYSTVSAVAALASTPVVIYSNTVATITLNNLTPNANYTLYVIVIDANGNSATNTTTFSTVIQSVNEIIPTQLNVYPNPASNKITVTYVLSESTSVDAKLYTIAGVEVKSIALGTQNSGNQTITIDIENQKEGLYILQIKTKSGVVNVPVVVKH